MIESDKESMIRSLKRHAIELGEQESTLVDYDREKIARILPHRGSMALLDRITRISLTEATIEAETAIREEDSIFAGHFPGNPLYPGVLQIEMMGQAGLCISHFQTKGSATIEESDRPILGVFTRVHNAGFIQPVRPGDRVIVRAKTIEQDELIGIIAAQLLIDGKICAHSILEVYFS